MCTSETSPDFFFSTAGKPYYADDIDPGTAGELHAGTAYTTKIRVHNAGGAAPAMVRLYVCPPATSVTAGTALLLREKLTTNPVPACVGSNDGTRSGAQSSSFSDWTYAWDPGNYFTPSPGKSAVHMCLFAQVRSDGLLGKPGTNYPTSSDPNVDQNAQHNIDVVDIVYPLRRTDVDRFFAFGIANPLPQAIETEVVAAVIKGDSPELAAMRAGNRRLAKLIGAGDLAAPVAAGMALGKERLLATHKLPIQVGKGSRARDERSVRRFGSSGELDRDTFDALEDSAVKPKHSVSLLPGEVRQGLLSISLPPKAKPGAIFIVDIRHHLGRKGKSARQPTLMGGLLVVFRVVKERS
jgi:hypothetical protein